MARQDTVDTADTAVETPEMMTVEQAAKYLQVNPKTLYRWLKNGEVPGAKLNGNMWRVEKAMLDMWVRRQSIENIIANAPRVTKEWLERVTRRREELLEEMGGVPFKGDEIERMIDEGRK